MYARDRFGREDPQDLGTHWPREVEGEAEEGGAEWGVRGRRRSPSGTSEAGWPVRTLGNRPWPGSAWGPLPGTVRWKGHSPLAQDQAAPLGDKPGIPGPETPCQGPRAGPSPGQREGCALPAPGHEWVGWQWRWVSLGNPTPTCQPRASAGALGRAPKRSPGHTGRWCGGHAAFSGCWCNRIHPHSRPEWLSIWELNPTPR